MSEARWREGDVVAHYTLIRPLGRGGFSEVWLASSSRDPTSVALKLLSHPEHVRALREESAVLGVVGGAGVVRVREVGLENDPPYLALELISGGDLRRRLAEAGKLDPTAVVTLIERVLETLARLHADGIVHGDLKPENVLLDGVGRPRLADFGLSRRVAQRTASLSMSLSHADARLAGTLEYMAPEQRGGEKPTARSDVFAVGVIFHELLVGERPQGAFRLPGELNRSLPPVVDRTLALALAADPAQRFPHAGGMLRFLRWGIESDRRRAISLDVNDTKGLRTFAAWWPLYAYAVPTLLLTFGLVAVATDERARLGTVLLGSLAPVPVNVLILAWGARWARRRADELDQVAGSVREQRGLLMSWIQLGLGDVHRREQLARRDVRILGAIVLALGVGLHFSSRGAKPFDNGWLAGPLQWVCLLVGLVLLIAPARARRWHEALRKRHGQVYGLN